MCKEKREQGKARNWLMVTEIIYDELKSKFGIWFKTVLLLLKKNIQTKWKERHPNGVGGTL